MNANHGPDFIWATFDENVSEQTCDVYAQTIAEGFVDPPLRYRRADLPPTDAEVMAHPKVKALVEALRFCVEMVGGDAFGSEWKRQNREFLRIARDALDKGDKTDA